MMLADSPKEAINVKELEMSLLEAQVTTAVMRWPANKMSLGKLNSKTLHDFWSGI